MPRQTRPGTVANTFLRLILTSAGAHVGGLTTAQWEQTLEHFSHCCAYTGLPLPANLDKDHAVPMNRAAGGLHVFGNVLPALPAANAQKHNLDYRAFLRSPQGRYSSLDHLSPAEREDRVRLIEAFQRKADPEGRQQTTPELLAFYARKYAEITALCAAASEEVVALLGPPATTASAPDEAVVYDLPDEAQLLREQSDETDLPPAYQELLTRFADRPVGAFARALFQLLFADGRIGPWLERLQEAAYSRQHVGLYFPVLTRRRTEAPERYYATPLLFAGQEYYLSNDWRNERRGLLEDWLLTEVAADAATR